MANTPKSYEILESIKHLLDEKTPALPAYAEPKVPRALPEKKGFLDKESVLFQILDKALLYKYKDAPLPKDKKVVLFTWVIPSGLGDLSMQIHIAEMLHRKEPSLKIELVSIIDERSPLPDALRASLPHHILFYKHPAPPTFPAKIKKLLRKAFSVIEIPTAYYDFPTLEKILFEENPAPPILSRIGQYGFIDTKDYLPTTKERSMGLYELEKGIVVLPEAAAVERDHNTYFAYLITKEGITTYLWSLLLHRKKDEEHLTILLPNLAVILPYLEEMQLANFDIKEICIQDGPSSSTLSLQEKGKTLTIVHQKNISQKEIMQLMATCNPFVGIRGDGSFTECLATDSIFFYDALDHAIPFLIDLYAVAKQHLLPYFSLCEYLPLLYQTKEDPLLRAKKIAELLHDPSLAIGMEKLRAVIRERYPFNDSLLHLIKQNYAFYKGGKEKEQRLFADYVQEKISLYKLLSE